MKSPSPRISRRALLAVGAGLTAAPVIDWASRDRLALFTQARGVPAPFLAQLVERLETAFVSAGRPTRVTPVVAERHADLEVLSGKASADALVFAGSSWAAEWTRALPKSTRVWQLSLGADLEVSDAAISTSLWQGLELGGAFSAAQFGRRAAVLVAGDQAATDLSFAYQHGFERAGGDAVQVVVAHAGFEADAWARVQSSRPDVVAVLASGRSAAELWRHAPAGLPTVTHAFSGGEGRSHVVHEALPALDVLAQRTVARILGQRGVASPLHLTTPSGRVIGLGSADDVTLASRIDLSLRNRSAFPFTGC